MKQQRRHELQTNQLADQLGHYLKDVQPYSNHILFGIAAVVALIFVLVWWNGSRSRSLGASWGDYFDAAASREASAMDEVAKLHPGTPAAVWAHLSAGDMQFAKGTGLMFRDRDEAKDVLEEAEQHYLAAVEGGAADYPWLMERAQYGLGQVNETQANVDKAISYYQAAAAINGDSVIGKAAQERADLLADADVKGWYNWFDRQEPPTPGGMPGGSGLGPNLPGDLESLPDRPNLTFPSGDLPLSVDDVTPDELPAEDDSSADMELTPPDTAETPAPDSTGEKPDTGEAAPEAPAEPEADNPAAPEAPASTEENS